MFEMFKCRLLPISFLFTDPTLWSVTPGAFTFLESECKLPTVLKTLNQLKRIDFHGNAQETATAGSDVVQSGRPIFDDFFQHLCTAVVAEWYRHRIVAGFVTSSSPVPLKTRRVGQRCTLNLSRAEMSSRWCGVVVRRGGASSGVVHVT
ncbi:uncharacterized protein TNCV_4963561 [Trichonephila clavipes]|nr:uncharacterized protein TNCV_4963561 [Trichonephila clavipes]